MNLHILRHCVFLPLSILLSSLLPCWGEYDPTIAQIGVFLSGAAYCGKDKYTNMTLAGPAQGFVVDRVLYDASTDLEGFSGAHSPSKSIFIVYRGSSSRLNWEEDFEVAQVKYDTWSECEGCKVHRGFYQTAKNLIPQTLDAVRSLVAKYGDYDVYLTGHSLAACVSDLLSMELLIRGILAKVYGYGKARVGNKPYSAFYNSKVAEHYRHTHYKDMVPHLPPMTGFGYYHSCVEIYENERGELRMCSQSDCEDASCGNQFSLSQTNSADHSYYLGHYLSCETSTVV